MNVVFLVFTLLFFSPTECAKKCYVCKDPQCEDVKEQTCKTKNFMCQTSSQTINGVTKYIRECLLDTEKLKDDCKKYNLKEGSSCYTCYKDLCNSQAKASDLQADSLDLGEGSVEKCYACQGQCEHPKEQTCEFNDYLCMAFSMTINGTISGLRECIPNVKEAKEYCKKANAEKNTRCYTCDKDLCNNKSPFSKGNRDGNAAETYSAPAMLLTVLVSLLLVLFPLTLY